MIRPDDFDQKGATEPALSDVSVPAAAVTSTARRTMPRALWWIVPIVLAGAWLQLNGNTPLTRSRPGEAPITAASVSQPVMTEPLMILGVLPASPYDRIIRMNLSLSGKAQERVLVIARFHRADGGPMPGVADAFSAENGQSGNSRRQAAAWREVVVDPSRATVVGFALMIPNTAIEQGDGLFAVISVEDRSQHRKFASVQTPPFSNRW